MHIYYPGQDENIYICGRTVKQNPLPLFWSASGVELITDGTEFSFVVESGFSLYEQWIRIEVDGFQTLRMPLRGGREKITLFRGMNSGVQKRIRLYKEVQAMRDDPQSFLLLHAVETDGQLFPLPPYSCRLEFVGDSITSGEGLAGAQCMHEWNSSVFSSIGSYALKVAEAFQADYRLISQSGWGTFYSFDNQPQNNLPSVYEEVCSVVRGTRNAELHALEKNDFTAWKPDAVIINLGTNDGGSFQNPAWMDPESGLFYQQRRDPDGQMNRECLDHFEKAVRDFLTKLRRCNPDSYLLWVYGMIGHDMEPYLQHAVAQYQSESGDTQVSYLSLPDMQAGWQGANDHPGLPSHEAAAETIIAEMRKISFFAQK